MMGMKRILSVGLLATMVASFATADFDGPAPLAWRWVQPGTSSPTGSPTIQDGTVYVATGNRMYALDKETGNQKWKFPLVDPIDGSFKSTVMLTEGMAIAAGNNKTIYGVDAKTGESRWSYVAPTPIYREPVIASKFVVFAMTDNTLMAINVSDGQPAWNAPIKVHEGFMGRLAAYQSNVYYFNNNYEMVSLSATTQKANWKQRFSVIGPDVEAVNLSDNLYVNSGSYMIGVNAVSGRKVYEGNANEQLAFAPAVNGDSVLSVDLDGKVYLFGSNGRPMVRKEINLGSQPATRPSVAGRFYVVPTRNGAINLIDSKTGDVAWSYLVRPIGESSSSSSTTGRGPGGPGGAEGPGGLGGPGGRGPGGAGGAQQTSPTKVLAIPAAGPAVLSGDTLFILAQDGSVLAFDKQLGVDLTPPSVKMVWPNAGDMVNGQPPLELIFKIEDEASGIDNKTIKIMADGQDLEYEFGRDGIALVKISSLGKNKGFTNGRKVITVMVSDWLGNQTRAEFALIIDNTLRPLQRPANEQNSGGGRGGVGGGGGIGGVGR